MRTNKLRRFFVFFATALFFPLLKAATQLARQVHQERSRHFFFSIYILS